MGRYGARRKNALNLRLRTEKSHRQQRYHSLLRTRDELSYENEPVQLSAKSASIAN